MNAAQRDGSEAVIRAKESSGFIRISGSNDFGYWARARVRMQCMMLMVQSPLASSCMTRIADLWDRYLQQASGIDITASQLATSYLGKLVRTDSVPKI